MRDFDNDGWGDPVAPVGGVAGSDCDDTDDSLEKNDDKDGDSFGTCDDDCDDTDDGVFPGAAELESPTDCMRDRDQDGYGDFSSIGTGVPGVTVTILLNVHFPGAVSTHLLCV